MPGTFAQRGGGFQYGALPLHLGPQRGGAGYGGYGGGFYPPPQTPPQYAPPPLPPPPPAPEPIQLSAELDPNLMGLGEDYKAYIRSLTTNSGKIMDLAGSRMRDSREGGRKALRESAALRGVDDSKALASYDAETQGNVTRAVADTATERERTLGAALQGGVNVFGAPKQLALQEKGLGLSAWSANQAANNQNWSSYLALLSARNATQPRSPMYGGYY